MYLCEICGKEDLNYKVIENEWYIVCSCGRKELVIPTKSRCFCCGTEYDEINWNIPSACNVCHKSFVD